MQYLRGLGELNTMIRTAFIGTAEDQLWEMIKASLKELKEVPKEIVRISNADFLMENDLNLLIWDYAPQQLPKHFKSLPVIILTDNEFSTGSPFHITIPKKDLNKSFIQFAVKSVLEMHRTHHHLNELEYRNRIMAGNSTEIIWEWDLKTDLLVFNREGWSKVIGDPSSPGVITFDEWMNQVHAADNQRVRDFFKAKIADKSTVRVEVEYRMMSTNGYIHLKEVGVIYRDEHGVAYRITGSSRDISDRKRSEEELRKLSHIVRSTNNSVVLADVEGRITWVNDAFVRTTGYAFEEVIGKKPGHLLQTQKTDPEVIRYMSRALKNLQGFECEVLNKKKSGEEIWFWVQCQPQFNQNGDHDGYFAIQTNITADKKFTDSIAANELRLQNLLENNNDGLSVVSADGNTMLLFKGRNVLGYDESFYIADNMIKYIHPDDAPNLKEAFENVSAKPYSSFKKEFRAKKATGEYIWMECVFRNLLEEESIKGIVINFRDINERKTAESLIQSSEIKYRNLFNNNPLALIIWDYDTYKILEVNDFAVKEYGYSQQEFKKLKVTDLIVPDKLPRFKGIVEQWKKESFRVSYKSENVRKNGDIIHVIITYQPVELYERRANLAMINNITEQVLLEKKLAEEQDIRQLEITRAVINAQEQERQHLGRELHDNINQILATTRLYIEYAMSNENIRAQLLNDARNLILTAVNEIRNLSNSLMPNAFTSAGLIPSINDLLNTLRKINKFEIEQQLNFDDVELPDSLQLTIFRIVQEQLNNIIKYAQASKISVDIMTEGELLIVSIKDNGLGFDVEKVNSGLGLKNIKSRAALHRGDMEVFSSPGKGTELKVWFKLQV